MKHTSLLFALMIGTWSFAKSQITITNVAFPKAGDSLQISTDNTVADIKIPKSGVNQTFDGISLHFSEELSNRYDANEIKFQFVNSFAIVNQIFTM